MKYQIWNIKKQCWASAQYKSRKRAQARADILDLRYGAIAYRVVEINDEKQNITKREEK